ncbi:MAG: hypothetical protein ABSA21_05575 [Candidatus Limnocylindrales bacterium]|jgi:heme-degrading monooxygenase HmoA
MISSAGTRLSRHQSEHIVVTCWRTDAAFARGTDPQGVPAYLSPRADLLSARRPSTFRVTASLGSSLEGARILRVYRAQVAAASIAAWERRAAELLTSLSATDGLVAMRAGSSPAGAHSGSGLQVVAVSAWRDWDAVLAATGGHIDRLLQETELADVEEPIGVDHYELLGPDA